MSIAAATGFFRHLDAGKWADIGQATIDTLLMLAGSLPLTMIIGLPLGVLLFPHPKLRAVAARCVFAQFFGAHCRRQGHRRHGSRPRPPWAWLIAHGASPPCGPPP